MSESAPTAVAVLTLIVKSIVDQPDAVTVEEATNDDGKHRLDVRVGPGDLGRVIGVTTRASWRPTKVQREFLADLDAVARSGA